MVKIGNNIHSERKNIPLSNINAVKIKEHVINIDPQLLFQRLITAGTRNDSIAEVFEYELCSYPPALFENWTTPRPATKSSLADALCKLMPPDLPTPSGDVQYVLDGGALRHRIRWNRVPCMIIFARPTHQMSHLIMEELLLYLMGIPRGHQLNMPLTNEEG